MKILLLIFFSCFSLNSFAIQYESKISCKNGVCEKKEIYTGITGPDLKIEDLQVGQCLLDNSLKVFYRVTERNVSDKKIVLVSEIEDEPVTVVMKREVVYTDSRNFNVKLRILPCSDVNGQVINDEVKFAKCLESNGPRTLKLYCEKDRKRNF